MTGTGYHLINSQLLKGYNRRFSQLGVAGLFRWPRFLSYSVNQISLKGTLFCPLLKVNRNFSQNVSLETFPHQLLLSLLFWDNKQIESQKYKDNRIKNVKKLVFWRQPRATSKFQAENTEYLKSSQWWGLFVYIVYQYASRSPMK